MVQPLNICYLCYTVLFSWSEISTLGHMQVQWYLWLHVSQSSDVSVMASRLQYNTYTFEECLFSQTVDKYCCYQWMQKQKTGSTDAYTAGSGLQVLGLCQHDSGTELPHRFSTGMQWLPPPHQYTMVPCRNPVCVSVWPTNDFLSWKEKLSYFYLTMCWRVYQPSLEIWFSWYPPRRPEQNCQIQIILRGIIYLESFPQQWRL